MKKLKGKLMLLTGATGGIGQAIAKRLAKQGVSLILVGRNLEQLTSLASAIQLNKTDGFMLVADIATYEGHEKIRTALTGLSQPLDALINCAGVNAFGLFEDAKPEVIEKLLMTNINAPIQLTRLSLPYLQTHDARIVNIGSGFGRLGYPGYAVYCASKFALRGFSEALRRELSDTHIQVAYLAPRATSTRMNNDAVNAMNQELGNASDDPDLVAAQVQHMLSSARMRDINMGWPERLFLALNSIMPGIIDKALKGQLETIRRYARAGTSSGSARSSGTTLKNIHP